MNTPATPPPPWRPSAQIESAVREWISARGFAVDCTRYYADEEVYAWRQQLPGGSPTLWIARPVLEDHEAGQLVASLEQLGVAERMRKNPTARFLVVDEDGHLYVVPWRHGPHRGP